MSQHYTNKEIIEFTEGNFSLPKATEISKHIARCTICKANLEKIAPEFIDEKIVSVNERHFSEGEIVAFLKAETSLKNRLEMSEHLRNCAVCKNRLYGQNPQFLKQTVAAYLNKDDSAEKKPFFSTFNALIPVGAMALLLIAALFFALPKTEDTEQLQTKINEINEIQPTISASPTNSVPHSANQNVDEPPPKTASDSPTVERKPTPKVIIKQIAKEKPVAPDKLPREQNKTNKPAVSASRSAQTDCVEEERVATISPNFEKIIETQPTLRWKKFPQAVKYNVYVSDTAQILIEEAEVVNETSYKLKTLLELDKPYKWSVVGKTADGKTFPSQPMEFSVGKKAQKYKVARVKNETRCLNEKNKSRDK
jgi:hypothetical protein